MQYRDQIKDTFWLIGLQGLNYLVPLFMWPYLMVVLGADRFGLIGFANSVAQMLILLVDFGFNMTATKRIAQLGTTEDTLDKVFSETMYSKLVLLLVSLVCLGGVVAIPRFAIYRPTCLIMFLMVVGNAFSFLWLYQGLGMIRLVSVVTSVSRLLIFPLTFWLVKHPDDVYIAAFIQAATYLIAGIVMCVITRCKRLVHWTSVSVHELKFAIMDAFPVFLSNATSSVYVFFFVMILGYFTSSAEVGCYSAAEKLMRMACYALLSPVLQAFYPKVSSLAGTDRHEAYQLCRKLARLVGAIMLVVGLCMFVSADYLMAWIGKGYDHLNVLLRVMAVIPIFIGVGAVYGQTGLLAIGQDREKRQFRNTYIAAAVLALTMILLLSPILTGRWAALALMLTEGFVMCRMAYVFYKMQR